MTDSDAIVVAESLRRDFKETHAVQDLHLQVEAGELFGIVGPDGAGKTTLLRLLAGLLKISGGTASVAGHDLDREAESVKPLIGYMAQEFSLYGELTVLENLQFFAEVYDVEPDVLAARTERLLSFAGLSEFHQRRASQLSGGMQKKLALACTLIHEPQVLLLDEPTTGVDPVARREFWDILTDLHLRGTTILVSTPYMDEADRCSRVGLMYAGRMVICDTPRRIRDRLAGEVIQLYTQDWRRARALVEKLPGVLEVQTYGEALHLLVDSAQIRLPEIAATLKRAGEPFRSLRPAPARMEEAFVSLIRKFEEQPPVEVRQ